MFKKIFLFLVLGLSLNACVYSKVKMPMDEDVNQTELGSKVGRASNKSIMWLVAWGDAGTQAAAKNGNIKIIRHLDVERYIFFFGLYTEITTIAYGD